MIKRALNKVLIRSRVNIKSAEASSIAYLIIYGKDQFQIEETSTLQFVGDDASRRLNVVYDL